MRVLFLMRDDGFMTEPMNIMELSSLAKLDMPQRSTHLAVIERDDVVQIARDLRPQVVACSAITGSHKQYIEALKAVKSALPESKLGCLAVQLLPWAAESRTPARCRSAVTVLSPDLQQSAEYDPQQMPRSRSAQLASKH